MTSAARDASSASKVQVNIEGDLSDAEMKEIQDLISALGTTFRSGGQAGTSALAETVSGMTTLAGFDFAYREHVAAGAVNLVA